MTQLDLQPFRLTADDLRRFRGHKRAMLEELLPGYWVARDRLVQLTGSKNFTARISDLRGDGFDIQCSRDGSDGGTYYRLEGKYDTPLTKQVHQCPNCGTRF